jgi:hypothetical protein
VYKFGITILIIVLSFQLKAQFHPPVGSIGTSAMHKDSSVFVGWADQCIIQRGELDISNPSLGYASVGDNLSAIGQAGINGVVSLGDAGVATLTFESTIYDGPGWDFAVFENSFNNTFLELAFVEVSSNGIDFFRFPAVSNTQDSVQIDNAGSVDATKINNLAGKYRSLYGTPFDLADLPPTSFLDVNNVSHIRVIDVVGSIDDNYSSYDNNGTKINDPWSTPFPSSGFDLDAVGLIHLNPLNIEDQNNLISEISVFPNPITTESKVCFSLIKNNRVDCIISDVFGKEVGNYSDYYFTGKNTIDLKSLVLSRGVYFISLISQERIETIKVLKNDER